MRVSKKDSRTNIRLFLNGKITAIASREYLFKRINGKVYSHCDMGINRIENPRRLIPALHLTGERFDIAEKWYKHFSVIDDSKGFNEWIVRKEEQSYYGNLKDPFFSEVYYR